MAIILLKGKLKHLSCNPHSTKNIRGIGLKISIPLKPFGFRNLYVMFPVMACINSCFRHLNELENLPSPVATCWHEAGVMEESGLSLVHDDDTTAYRQCFIEP